MLIAILILLALYMYYKGFSLIKEFLNAFAKKLIVDALQTYQLLKKGFQSIDSLRVPGMIGVEGIITPATSSVCYSLKNSPCCSYEFEIQKIRNGNWVSILNHRKNSFFILQDATGSCLVSTYGAEIALNQKEVWEENTYPVLSPEQQVDFKKKVMAAYEQRSFPTLSKNNAIQKTIKMARSFNKSYVGGEPGRFQVTESVLYPNQKVKVYGLYREISLTEVNTSLKTLEEKQNDPIAAKGITFLPVDSDRKEFLLALKAYLIREKKESVAVIHNSFLGSPIHLITDWSDWQLKRDCLFKLGAGLVCIWGLGMLIWKAVV